MNIYILLDRNFFFEVKRLCSFNFILYIFLLSRKFIVGNIFVYRFEIVEEAQLLFYNDVQKHKTNLSEIEEEYYLKTHYTIDSDSSIESKWAFTYTKDNYIGFEVLNNILDANRSEKINGKIECNFELIFFLKLTNNISLLPEKVNCYQLKCMLLTLKYLKALESKHIGTVLKGLLFKMYFGEQICFLKYKESFRQIFFAEIEYFIIKKLIQAFLNILMVNHTFHSQNLILLKNSNEIFDITLFNEHIPYNNLLVNDCKILYILEKAFKNLYIFKIFQILLHQLHIKSLIINNFLGNETNNKTYYFSIFSKEIFKSIIISNLYGSLNAILYQLDTAFDENLEFFSLKNINVDCYYLDFFLKKRNLKGLILNDISMDADLYNFQAFVHLIKTLEYVEFCNIKMSYTWWVDFVGASNIKRIILSFVSSFLADFFLKEFTKVISYSNVQYLEIWFSNSKLYLNFWNCLGYFRSLQTLKLINYISDMNIELNLFKVIHNMQKLENLTIEHDDYSDYFYNFLFKRHGLKVLNVRNFSSNRKIIKLNLLNNSKFLTQLILSYIKITESSLLEIFKLEFLKVLYLQFCQITLTKNSESHIAWPKNIISLYFKTYKPNLYNNIDILSGLDYLENLYLYGCKSLFGSLIDLSLMCNLNLKTLSYKSDTIYMKDLQRIKYLERLEELNLSKCRFFGVKFYDLGDDCKFINSLKMLKLFAIKICPKDLLYIRNFKNLNYIKLSNFGFTVILEKSSLISLTRSHIISKKRYEEFKDGNILRNFYNEIIGSHFY
ncbi:hypothetical protein CWI38_1737p0020 [Hamiltosporidium tvaerminnensis]|uniref:Leucine-rich repeat-containing protein n=1 Tax=Hamiltosporidium tvaerminnensis TaxID=1176355 RepID=A0A4Q9LSF1_9MICR|nr:hypothetical protein CWI38_1737p0020 [Hamiltosporidium tvaerminnensis]